LQLAICNHPIAGHEIGCSFMIMSRRLFTLVALMLTALLPLEASIAASSCLVMRADAVAMADHDMVAAGMTEMDCDGGSDDAELADDCAAYCLALCQMVPSTQAAQTHKAIGATEHGRFSEPTFRLSPSAGPEPPPPRLAD
jgi:hypothetical protein